MSDPQTATSTARTMPSTTHISAPLPHLPSIRSLRRTIDIYTPTPVRPFAHATLTRLTSILNPFPLSRSPSPSDPGYIAPLEDMMYGEDSISLAHEREEEELAFRERGEKMEVISVPVIVLLEEEEEWSSGMSTPIMAGSEFLAPLLTESDYIKLVMEEEDGKTRERRNSPKPSFFGRVFGPRRNAEARGYDLAETGTFQAPTSEGRQSRRAQIEREWKAKAERQRKSKDTISHHSREKSQTDFGNERNMLLSRAVPFDPASRLSDKARARSILREKGDSPARDLECSADRRASSKFGNDGSRSITSSHDSSIRKARKPESVLPMSSVTNDGQADITSVVDDVIAKARFKPSLAGRKKYERPLTPAEFVQLSR
ncbi:hypothetical protein ACMFMF_001957 [Clarireedia jacksonii]